MVQVEETVNFLGPTQFGSMLPLNIRETQKLTEIYW